MPKIAVEFEGEFRGNLHVEFRPSRLSRTDIIHINPISVKVRGGG